MKISAHVSNSQNKNEVVLRTNDRSHSINIPPKANGLGADVNGGELLFLALATCYCNDVYREAAKKGINVEAVDVTVEGEFGAEGEAAKHIVYRARINAAASEKEVRDLLAHTDTVAEIQKTLRTGTAVTLEVNPTP